MLVSLRPIEFDIQTCDLQIESMTQGVTMRRHQPPRGDTHRLSEASVVSTE